MLKKNNKGNGFQKVEEFKQDEIGTKHQSPHSKELANDWKKTPEWAVNHVKTAAAVSEPISLARKIERLHKIKEENLGGDLSRLGEPAWKILIQLVIATEAQKGIPLIDISERISLPDTIAARYVNLLENSGLIARLHHPTDRMNDQLQLTGQGQSLMRKTLLDLDKI